MSRFIRYVTRRGQMRPFVTSLVIALLVMPVAEALAFFAATGTGNVTGIQAGTANSTVTLASTGPFTYGGGSTSNLIPGGTVSFEVTASCTASCPAGVSTINLGTWSSNKTGCDPTDMPGSFTMPTINANTGVGTDPSPVGTATITWVNLPTEQNACSGAVFTFTLTTP